MLSAMLGPKPLIGASRSFEAASKSSMLAETRSASSRPSLSPTRVDAQAGQQHAPGRDSCSPRCRRAGSAPTSRPCAPASSELLLRQAVQIGHRFSPARCPRAARPSLRRCPRCPCAPRLANDSMLALQLRRTVAVAGAAAVGTSFSRTPARRRPGMSSGTGSLSRSPLRASCSARIDVGNDLAAP